MKEIPRLNDTKCRRCMHRTTVGMDIACMYCVNEHELRGCPAGDACIRFREGDPPKYDYTVIYRKDD